MLLLAVLAPLPTLAQRMRLDDVATTEKEVRPTTLIDTRMDPLSRRTYALAKSGVLGSGGDLWLLEKDGQAWKNPLFVGISLDGVARRRKGEPIQDHSAKAFGKTADELTKGAWMKTLLDHLPELTRDSDGDGMTDREEARLGSDAKRSDTDGDGVPDGVDSWPTVALRVMNDEDHVYAAVFEAGSRRIGLSGPAIVFLPPRIRPFKMPGWPGPALWGSSRHPRIGTLGDCYETGVMIITLLGGADPGPFGEGPILWNRDHTEAKAKISLYIGSLAGETYAATVRREGDNWKVVALEMTSIS